MGGRREGKRGRTCIKVFPLASESEKERVDVSTREKRKKERKERKEGRKRK